MGGSLGALFGVTYEIAFDDPRLDDFATSLAKILRIQLEAINMKQGATK